MTIVLFLIVGIAAGFLATRIMGLNTDPLTTIAIGVAGALVGGFVLWTLVMVLGWRQASLGRFLAPSF